MSISLPLERLAIGAPRVRRLRDGGGARSAGGKIVSLTPTEYELLRLLAQPGVGYRLVDPTAAA